MRQYIQDHKKEDKRLEQLELVAFKQFTLFQATSFARGLFIFRQLRGRRLGAGVKSRHY